MIDFLEKISALNDDNGKLSIKRLVSVILSGMIVLIFLSAVTNTLDSRTLRLGIIFIVILDLAVMLAAAKAIGDLKFKKK
jgi:hypothetical protein